MKTTIELTEKEMFVLWQLACWFEKPLITSSLKYKLYNSKLTVKRRKELKKRFEQMVLDEIVELGIRVNKNHPEWLSTKNRKDTEG